MSTPTKIDFSKLLGFDTVADELKKPTVARRIKAKVGAASTKTEQPMLMPLQSDAPGAPVMQGLGGRKVSSS
jgi:hypothetical protein